MTDPISDLLIRLKNAAMAGRVLVEAPYSNLKFAIAKLLEDNGYLKVGTSKGKRGRKLLELELVQEGKRAKLQDVKRLSKPSRRLYGGVQELRRVKNGLGLLVVSTPSGVMTGATARKAGVGGELLFEIW